jgi:transcriptional regulator with XRE-family HTH domain
MTRESRPFPATIWLHMASAFGEEVIRLRQVGGLSDLQISRAAGVARSTVGAWLRRQRRPTGVRAERVAELSAIVDRLARTIDPAYIPVWMSRPNAALGDEKPLDLIGQGEYRRVARLIGELESGVHS